MAKISLTKALKEKKKLIASITDHKSKIRDYNSYLVEGKETLPYNSTEALANYEAEVAKLNMLKVEISRANEPIQLKIYEMAELKALAAHMKNIPCKTGMEARSYNSSDLVEYDCFIKTRERDQLVKGYQDKIEQLQEDIESFNAVTKVNF